MIRKTLYWIKKKIAARNRTFQSYFEHQPCTIISCNCIGGLLYHDYHEQFLSPTIDLYIKSPDFIKFVRNLKEYISHDLIDATGDSKFPIGRLGDIQIFFLHYSSFAEAKEKWDRRKKRILYHRIFVIMSDRDEFTPDLVDDFLNLPYKKVLFSHKDYQHPEIVYVKKDRNKRMVDDLTKYINTRGTKVYEYYFDFDKWLTGNFETGDCKYER